MTLVSNLQADSYGHALCELHSFKCSSLYSMNPFFPQIPLTTFPTEPALHESGIDVDVCVSLGIARLGLQGVFHITPTFKRSGACA